MEAIMPNKENHSTLKFLQAGEAGKMFTITQFVKYKYPTQKSQKSQKICF